MHPVTLEVVARDGAARAGVAHTARGTYRTPCFMPVGTRGAVKYLSAADYDRLGVEIVLANTYHLMLRPGAEVVDRFGGVGRFAGWNGLTLTDSGGFQVFSLEPKVDDDGVTFRSVYDGSTHRLTPESAVATQEQLGADIQMVLDVCPPLPSPPAVVDLAVERTAAWAARARAAHRRDDQALFGIVQGGLDPDLRAESTTFIASLPFDGICIGGLAGDETPEQRDAALDIAVPLLADDPRPRYLMGLGSPADLLEAVHRGVDLFDSVLPARVARNGQLWIPGGRINARNRQFLDDPRPVQEDCPCLLCRSFSRAYVAHLFRANELLAYRLATCHNLTFTLDFMARIRAAIRVGNLPAVMPELRLRAGRESGREVAEKSA